MSLILIYFEIGVHQIIPASSHDIWVGAPGQADVGGGWWDGRMGVRFGMFVVVSVLDVL